MYKLQKKNIIFTIAIIMIITTIKVNAKETFIMYNDINMTQIYKECEYINNNYFKTNESKQQYDKMINITSMYPYRYVYAQYSSYLEFLDIIVLFTENPIKLRNDNTIYIKGNAIRYKTEFYKNGYYEYTPVSYNKTDYEVMNSDNSLDYKISLSKILDLNNNIIYSDEPKKISFNENNYIYITLPPDNYNTNLRDNSIFIKYRMDNIQSVDDIEIKIADENDNEIDNEVVYKEIITNQYEIKDNIIEGYINIHYKFSNYKTYKLKATIINKKTKKKLESAIKTINVIQYKDENLDGRDDVTGDKYEDIMYWNNKSDNIDNNKEKTRDGYPEGIIGELQYYFDKLINVILTPFKLIVKGIKFLIDKLNLLLVSILGFNAIVENIFSVFPNEVKSMIYLGISSLIIISIIKFMRS